MPAKAVYTRLALPKGKLLSGTSGYLQTVGLGFDDYNAKTRIYRLQSQTMPGFIAKMLNERDIPVQVSVGNYDLGICSSDWLQELQARYPASNVFKIADLDYDEAGIFLACSAASSVSMSELDEDKRQWRIVTEYPALAEAAAYRMRLKRFRIFPLWGSADAYPPENAELAVLKARHEDDLCRLNLSGLKKIADSSACIIANSSSLQSRNFSKLVDRLTAGLHKPVPPKVEPKVNVSSPDLNALYSRSGSGVWLAIADGHQQAHTAPFLEKAGIKINGYSKDDLQRRPVSSLDGVNIKVIRPQDMPQQVANGNFDLAITGKDWLLDHLYQFPSSPVTGLVDLGFGWVRIVAVVSDDVPAENIEDIGKLIAKGQFIPLRIATEYINIADKYLRDRHIARYRVIPTWGATEVYLPEDADMLIENTETGQTLARHKLKIIDTLFESTAWLIGNRNSLADRGKRNKINEIIRICRSALEKK